MAARKIKNFRLSVETCRALKAATKRTGMSERFIVEYLILKHAGNLHITNGTYGQEKK